MSFYSNSQNINPIEVDGEIDVKDLFSMLHRYKRSIEADRKSVV